MLVNFENVEDKKAILRLAKDLRQSPTWSNVYISLDQTQKQRGVSWELRAECKSRRDAGEKNLVIHNGKITKVANCPQTQVHPQGMVQVTPSCGQGDHASTQVWDPKAATQD